MKVKKQTSYIVLPFQPLSPQLLGSQLNLILDEKRTVKSQH